jgi:hypothetical protein
MIVVGILLVQWVLLLSLKADVPTPPRYGMATGTGPRRAPKQTLGTFSNLCYPIDPTEDMFKIGVPFISKL